MENSENKSAIEQASKELVKDPNMRFVGVINKLGRVISECYREGISSLLQDKEDRMISMQLALEIFLREEFNEKLGPIEYVLSKRKKVNLISIPIKNYLVLISTDPGTNSDQIAEKAMKTFEELL